MDCFEKKKKNKNPELMGNNLWYSDSVKYKYKTRKVRVTYAWAILQSKIYFTTLVIENT